MQKRHQKRQRCRSENIRDGRDTEETRTIEPAPTGEPAGRGRVETGDASEDECGERCHANGGERVGRVAETERHRKGDDDDGKV